MATDRGVTVRAQQGDSLDLIVGAAATGLPARRADAADQLHSLADRDEEVCTRKTLLDGPITLNSENT
jgi:hypothetical protein